MKHIAICLLLFTAIPGMASTNGPPIGIQGTVTTTSLVPWDFKGLLGYAAMRSRMSLDFSTNVYAGNACVNAGMKCTFHDTEARHVVAWVTKFLNATVRIENGTLVVRPASEQPMTDPVFECTEETEGEWKPRLERKLLTPMTGNAEDRLDFNAWIKVIAERAALSLIIDPCLVVSSSETLALPPSANAQTCGSLLKSGLGRLGLTYRLQGGVVYITE